MPNKIFLLFHTIKYLRLNQTFGRVLAYVKRKFKLYRLPEPPSNLKGRLNPKFDFIPYDPWNNREDILKGIFRFEYKEHHLDYPINWNNNRASDVCNLHLHFFNFLHLLSDDEKTELCLDWIRENSDGVNGRWEPYALSLRINSWMRANLDHPEIIKSIYIQAAYLYENNEYYVPANHYFENARALVTAGIFFNLKGESLKWYNKGINIFRNELPIQVLSDGGYFERSILYHAIALLLMLDILNILDKESPDRQLFIDRTKVMSDFLCSTTHPDNHISLFSDSSLEMIPPTDRILEYSQKILDYKAKFQNHFPDTGYFTFSGQGIYFIIDGGPLGAKHIPGHGHADIFSYELSYKGKRFIVDTGVSTYSVSDSRQFSRSTRAHNTVCIDKADQAEIWDSFKVARRFDPQNISFTHDKNRFNFEGEFKGYGKLIGDNLKHKREIFFKDSKISVRDFVTGEGNHLVESLIHLHPDCTLRINDKNIEIKCGGAVLTIQIEDGDFLIEESIYCPNIGVEKPNKAIVLKKEGKMPVQLVYSIILEN